MLHRMCTIAVALVLLRASAGAQTLASADGAAELRTYEAMAERGDDVAMLTIGAMYHGGHGVRRDYCAAMDWFLEALEHGNADALNNLGVMHREGQCAPVNRKIAYDAFLMIHMEGLGGEATVARADRNLRREAEELWIPDVEEALCYTPAYVMKYLRARGRLEGVPAELLPAAERPRMKDMDWWLDDEKKSLEYSCPAPWQ